MKELLLSIKIKSFNTRHIYANNPTLIYIKMGMSSLHGYDGYEPLLHRIRDERAGPALRGVSLTGSVRAKISAFANITVFVSRRLDIVAVKMMLERYEKMAGAEVNFDKIEGLRLGAWMGLRPTAMALPLE